MNHITMKYLSTRTLIISVYNINQSVFMMDITIPLVRQIVYFLYNVEKVLPERDKQNRFLQSPTLIICRI